MRSHYPAWPLALGLMAACGCSREAPPPATAPAAGNKAPAVSAAGPSAPAAPAPAAKQAAAPKAAATPPLAEPPIRVAALLPKGERGPRCGLVDKTSGRGGIYSQGDTVAGYRIASIDYRRERVVFERDGRTIAVPLSRGATGPEPAAAAATGTAARAVESGPPLPPADLKPPHFDPTPEETQAGINPNDPATWPSGYRGPAIERLLRARREQGGAAAPGATPGAPSAGAPAAPGAAAGSGSATAPAGDTYTATPEESAAGIDPNRPETWPEGYKGPGIHRALRERNGSDSVTAPPAPATPPPAAGEERLGPTAPPLQPGPY